MRRGCAHCRTKEEKGPVLPQALLLLADDLRLASQPDRGAGDISHQLFELEREVACRLLLAHGEGLAAPVMRDNVIVAVDGAVVGVFLPSHHISLLFCHIDMTS